jgi:hypothetical protein
MGDLNKSENELNDAEDDDITEQTITCPFCDKVVYTLTTRYGDEYESDYDLCEHVAFTCNTIDPFLENMSGEIVKWINNQQEQWEQDGDIYNLMEALQQDIKLEYSEITVGDMGFHGSVANTTIVGFLLKKKKAASN